MSHWRRLFDLRYHVASLAAVFLALIIGILVGVGISARGLLDENERRKLNAQITQLQNDLDAARTRGADVARQQEAARTFIEYAYPVLVEERLRGKRIALLFVGSIDAGLRASIERALADAGAVQPVRLRALKVPIDTAAIDGALARAPRLRSYRGKDALAGLGHALGREFMNGVETPLWDALQGQLVEERLGAGGKTDGAIVVRSVPAQQGDTARFLAALYSGLAASGFPVVATERMSTKPSTLDPLARRGLSTVDDVDTPPGRLALVLLLAGGEPGQYGVKATSEDGILPPIEPLPQPAPGG